jgi:subtilisin family serine protease
MIVVAAAGNCVDFIVAPAAYEDVIAVAATNAEDMPWLDSSHGRAIAISAPGEDVWCALAEGGTAPSNGTSFATAGTAGVAALWIAHHGRAAIDTARGDTRTQDLFVHLLGRTARVPGAWDTSQYGPGIVDAEALLRASLTTTVQRRPAAPSGEVEKLARLTDRDPAELREELEAVFASDDIEAAFDEYAAELSELALRDPEAFEAFLDGARGGPRRPGAERIGRDASEGLRAAMARNP